MVRLSRAAPVWLLSLLSLFASGGAVEAASGLSFLQSLRNDLGELDKLRGVSSVSVSPDGSHLYAAATDDDAIVVFSRAAETGLLSFLEAQVDNTGAVDGIDRVKAVVVSPDGAHVYAAGSRDDAVAVFGRDAATGALAFIERKRDGVDGVDGLNGADALALSPDGSFLYAAGADDDALAVFARSQTTGTLVFVEIQRNGLFGVTGLDRVRDVTVSPDGANVYAAADRDDSLTVFRRNVVTGALTFIERQRDTPDVGGIDGLDAAAAVVVSPDGKHVYGAGTLDDAVAIFSRDGTTGALTFISVMRDGVDGVEGLFGVRGLAIAPDGSHLYAAGAEDNALTVFERNPTTGALTFAGVHLDGVGDVTGLGGAEAAALSPDGANVYVAGATDDAVTTFSTHCADGTLDPDEQCDDGNSAIGDGCSSGCRIECSAVAGCDDADICTEERCRGGECSNPRCGFDGSLCELADSVPRLEDEPTCEPVPPKLRRAIIKRINRAGRLVQKARRRSNPDLSKLVERVTTEVEAIEKRAVRLEKSHRIPVACRDAVERSVAALADSLADILLHEQSCAF